MLRDTSLIPLSHQHHNGLALCVLMRRSLAVDASTGNVSTWARKAIDRFEVELVNHFEIEEQVQRMFGEGVKLHFHAVRHDEIAHLVEEAQHMERISLTRGLDNPKDAEQVEIFVPDGEVRGAQAAGSRAPARSRHIVLREPADQRAQGDSEQLCGARLVARALLQRVDDPFALRGFLRWGHLDRFGAPVEVGASLSGRLRLSWALGRGGRGSVGHVSG